MFLKAMDQTVISKETYTVSEEKTTYTKLYIKEDKVGMKNIYMVCTGNSTAPAYAHIQYDAK